MTDAMSDDAKRRDQLTRMSGSTEADAAPRIEVTQQPDGPTRIDVADTAAVRPGDPAEQTGAAKESSAPPRSAGPSGDEGPA